MNETLGQRQERFSLLVGGFLVWLNGNGWGVRLGEAWRSTNTAALDADQGIGIANSLHTLKLAIDLTLTRNGVVLTDSADYAAPGAHWKTLAPDCCWGGDFSKPDGDHFSIEYNGVK